MGRELRERCRGRRKREIIKVGGEKQRHVYLLIPHELKSGAFPKWPTVDAG